jgi:hypothetical protein
MTSLCLFHSFLNDTNYEVVGKTEKGGGIVILSKFLNRTKNPGIQNEPHCESGTKRRVCPEIRSISLFLYPLFISDEK